MDTQLLPQSRVLALEAKRDATVRAVLEAERSRTWADARDSCAKHYRESYLKGNSVPLSKLRQDFACHMREMVSSGKLLRNRQLDRVKLPTHGENV
jgi:hypothetical protein